jgi:hypothetical protein
MIMIINKSLSFTFKSQVLMIFFYNAYVLMAYFFSEDLLDI